MLNFSNLISFFYPLNCRCCKGALVKGETLFCLNCELNFSEVSHNENIVLEVEQLFWGKAEVEKVYVTFQFLKQENLQQLIHEFKYEGNIRLAIELGKQVGQRIVANMADIDVVSYVPMHYKKEKKRGYNQAEQLAKGISEVTKLPIVCALNRTENTTSQTEKGVYERFENMDKKFEVNPDLKIKHVLLVDDVITTGATLATCAKVLNGHDIKVSVACLAYRGLL